jgi:hypothetical protein
MGYRLQVLREQVSRGGRAVPTLVFLGESTLPEVVEGVPQE